MTHLKPIVEALIFASPEPVAAKTLYKLLEGETKEDVDAALEALRADYEAPRGLQMVEVAGGYQIVTRPELHEWVRKLFHDRTTQKLSVQSLETLAVIAYKQPVTAAEIAEIRGVSSSGGVLSTLIERRLIKTVGRKQVVGRPFMYATTREFLERFGLSDLSDLPKVEELSDALGFELPTGLTEPTVTTTPLPFEAEPSPESSPEAPAAEAPVAEAAHAEPADAVTAETEAVAVPVEAAEPVEEASIEPDLDANVESDAAKAEFDAGTVAPGEAEADPGVAPMAAEEEKVH